MEKLVIIVISLLLICSNSIAQIHDSLTDLEQNGLKGNVESIEEYHFGVNSKFEKDSLKRAYYTLFSPDGHMIEEGKINIEIGKRVPESVYKLRYNNSQIVGRYKVTADDSLIPVHLYQYDSLNRILESIRFYTLRPGVTHFPSSYRNDGGNVKIKLTYTYDEQGNTTMYKVWDWKTNAWQLRETIDIIKVPGQKKAKKKPVKFQREYHASNKKKYYEYSEKDLIGNWTSLIEYSNKKPVEITEIKIKYYRDKTN